MRNFKSLFWLFIPLLFGGGIKAQTVEYYAGNQRTGLDLMWFRSFLNAEKKPSSFLFFSRNRVSEDYNNGPAVFASTEAVSYNFKSGVGIVAVGSFLNSGFSPKAGVQYYKRGASWLFFGWLVTDLTKPESLDLFGLFRFQPKISDRLKLYTQVELFPVGNLNTQKLSVTERLRLGVRYQDWVFGGMADFVQADFSPMRTSENTGLFVRYEF